MIQAGLDFINGDAQNGYTKLKICISVFRLISLPVVLAWRAAFFEQGYLACFFEKKKMLGLGLTVYFCLFLLGTAFLLAAVTYPLTFAAAALCFFAAIFGETSLALYISSRMKIFESSKVAKLLFGGIIVEMFNFIPIFGTVYACFIEPVVCAGVFTQTALNAVVYKKLYTER